MMSQPMRPAHTVSCSTAAARNVSHAATATVFPSLFKRLAVLAGPRLVPENNRRNIPKAPGYECLIVSDWRRHVSRRVGGRAAKFSGGNEKTPPPAAAGGGKKGARFFTSPPPRGRSPR